MKTNEIFEAMRSDKAVRRAIVRRSPKLFFLYYFSHYVEYPMAPFHDEILQIAEKDDYSMFVLSAFRGSAKSTLLSLSFVIWSIISGKKKYILLVSQNQQKAQQFLGHIKTEFETNEPLRKDLGPFQEEKLAWNAVSLVIQNYNTRIAAVSTEQSVRGLRHGSHRPDLIILDDCEDQESVKTIESRDKLYRWLTGDVIPAGTSRTKIIVIGSILHPDCLIKRLQKHIDDEKINGVYRMYPIVDDNSTPTWLGKFPNTEAVEKEKARGIADREWSIEYMLQPILDENQPIKQEWIQYYDKEPNPAEQKYRYAATGVDLAISEKSTADYTAMVSGVITHEDDMWKLYTLPYPVNERLNGPAIQERIYEQSMLLGNGTPTEMFIENVAFQQAMIDLVRQKGIPTEGVSPNGNDKRARLLSISALIKSGRVIFPKRGAEKLIQQLVFFGIEKHDDLSDALVILVLKVAEREERNRLIIPKMDEPPKPKTQQESEKEIDLALGLEQEYERGNFNAMMSPYFRRY